MHSARQPGSLARDATCSLIGRALVRVQLRVDNGHVPAPHFAHQLNAWQRRWNERREVVAVRLQAIDEELQLFERRSDRHQQPGR